MNKKILMVTVFLIFAGTVCASTVDISVATDKSTYQLDETVIVSVTAYNPNSQPVTLQFPSALQATYLMDNTFNWTQGKGFDLTPVERTINQYSSYTWNLNHGIYETTFYPLNIGTHTVVGEVVGYGVSSPVQFEVVPEPTTFLLFSIGTISQCLVRHRRRNAGSVQ